MASSVSTTLHAIEVSPPLFTLQRRYTHRKVSDSWASFVAILRISPPRSTICLPSHHSGTPKHLHSSPLSLTTWPMNSQHPPPSPTSPLSRLAVLAVPHP